VTRERILVLFFFCSDVAIFAVRSRISGLLAQLTQWSLAFIREQVWSRAARWFLFKPKIPIWVNFGGPEIGKC
jgi:hypothetical protein